MLVQGDPRALSLEPHASLAVRQTPFRSGRFCAHDARGKPFCPHRFNVIARQDDRTQAAQTVVEAGAAERTNGHLKLLWKSSSDMWTKLNADGSPAFNFSVSVTAEWS